MVGLSAEATGIAVKTEVPGAVDWMMSPVRNMIAVVVPRRILVFQVDGGKIVKPEAMSVALEVGESVVMTPS